MKYLSLIKYLQLIRNTTIEINEDTDIDQILMNIDKSAVKLKISNNSCIRKNNINEIPEKIFELESLEEIDLFNFRCKKLPDKFFTSFKKLKRLGIFVSHAFEIESLGELLKKLNIDLKSLRLNIEKSDFMKLNEDMKISSLEDLVLKGNTSVVDSETWNRILSCFSGIKNLEIYSMENDNFLKGVLEKFPNIKNVKFEGCKLKFESFAENTSLEKMLLKNNELAKITTEFFNAVPNLKELEIINNSLKGVEFSNTRLKKLKISRNNELLDDNFLRKCFENEFLEELELSNNRIEKLPDDLSYNGSLKLVNLANNDIRNFPISFKEIAKNLELLNLKGNSNFNVTKSTLSIDDLHELLRNRLLPSVLAAKSIDSVYENLKKKSISWNFNYIKIKKPIDSQNQNFNQNEIFPDVENNNEIDLNKQQKMLQLIENINNLNESNKLISDWIEKTKDSCIEEKIYELNKLYLEHSSEIITKAFLNSNQLDEFVDDFIRTQKEICLDLTAKPPLINENFLIFFYWKNRLSNHLGFDTNELLYKKPFKKTSIDPYLGIEGNALDAFYQKFTPEYVVDRLYEVMTKNKGVESKFISFFKQISKNEIKNYLIKREIIFSKDKMNDHELNNDKVNDYNTNSIVEFRKIIIFLISIMILISLGLIYFYKRKSKS